MVSVYESLHMNYRELAAKGRAMACLQAEDELPLSRRRQHFECLSKFTLEEPVVQSVEDSIPPGGIERLFDRDDMDRPGFQQQDRLQRCSGPQGQSFPGRKRGSPRWQEAQRRAGDCPTCLIEVFSRQRLDMQGSIT
mmetsp:Transcript_33135/g.93806  ORF Transcript_33135/g.93806 Transcript_33135/m.93806 type:complete len:137 (-) Transcript_33135:11-421(-)